MDLTCFVSLYKDEMADFGIIFRICFWYKDDILLEGFHRVFSIMNGYIFTEIPHWKSGKDVQPSL